MADVSRPIGNAYAGNPDRLQGLMRHDSQPTTRSELIGYSLNLERLSERLRNMVEDGEPPSKDMLEKLTRNDVELVEDYIRYFIIIGDTANAKKFSNHSGVSLNWAEERDVIAMGYANIVNGAALFVGAGTKVEIEIKKDAIVSLMEMGDLTGIRIPDEMHKALLDVIAKTYSNTYMLDVLESYLKAVDLGVTQAYADRLYSKVVYNTSVQELRKAFRLYGITGMKPSDNSRLRQCFAGLLKLDDFPRYLTLFVNTENADEVRDFVENGSLHMHGVAAIKLALGIPVSEKEMDAGYRHVKTKYIHNDYGWKHSGNVKEDRLGGSFLAWGLRHDEIEYLKSIVDKTIEHVEQKTGETFLKSDFDWVRGEILSVLEKISNPDLVDQEGVKAALDKLSSLHTSTSGVYGVGEELRSELLALLKEIRSSIRNAF